MLLRLFIVYWVSVWDLHDNLWYFLSWQLFVTRLLTDNTSCTSCHHHTQIIGAVSHILAFPLQSLCTWRLHSYISTDEHIGVQECLREGDHQGLKQTQGRCIRLLHDLTVHVLIWQTHALPQPAKGDTSQSHQCYHNPEIDYHTINFPSREYPPFEYTQVQYVCPGERLPADASIWQVPHITEPLRTPTWDTQNEKQSPL